ncbi:MAG TPA: neutral zinc metallopeptidase [Steroidobacteraceae bacterium]|jgi:hypothetical protein|nr:neutral zinc metallopeptidase [Steroidobacteraceae bacterium]
MRRIVLALVGVAAALAASSALPAAVPAGGGISAGANAGIGARAQALLAHGNDYWSREIASLGGSQYLPAKLAVYSTGHIDDVCGTRLNFSGPFYCPSDQKIYLDQDYLRALMRQVPAPDFDVALAAVIGHEFGRHIQTLVGTTALVEQARARSTAQVSRQTWITAALQADCYAGVWMHAAQMDGTIKPGADVSAALSAVAAVSRRLDTHRPSGVEMPDPVMGYASAAQRLKWFRQGLDTGSFNDCDTFKAEAAGTL